MSGLRELYQEVIIDHSKQPRHYGCLSNPHRQKEGFNPLCGDRLHVYLNEKGDALEVIRFEGSGCAISMASASLMCDTLQGKTKQEVLAIFEDFHELLTKGPQEALAERLGKLAVFAGVSEYPARVKCATLCWHTLKAAIENDLTPVSTES
jgi:nitrogen fixation protein NifU and related proteins